MRGVFRFLDGMDRAFRWAMFFPVGIIASLIVVGIVDAGFNAYWGNPRTFPGVVENSILAFLADLTRTLFPAIIAPRRWLVAIIMFTLNFLLRMVPVYTILTHEYMQPRLPGVMPIIAAGVVGGLLGLLLVKVVAKVPVAAAEPDRQSN